MLWAQRTSPATGPAWEDFQGLLAALGTLLAKGPRGTRLLFHASFAKWLLDVKHCMQQFLCGTAEGHTTLALSATAWAPQLAPGEAQGLAQHLL